MAIPQHQLFERRLGICHMQLPSTWLRHLPAIHLDRMIQEHFVSQLNYKSAVEVASGFVRQEYHPLNLASCEMSLRVQVGPLGHVIT